MVISGRAVVRLRGAASSSGSDDGNDGGNRAEESMNIDFSGPDIDADPDGDGLSVGDEDIFGEFNNPSRLSVFLRFCWFQACGHV